MFQPLRKFVFGRDDDNVAEAYVSMFCEAGDVIGAEECRAQALSVLRDAKARFVEMGPPELSDKIVCATVIPSQELSDNIVTPPVVDLSIMGARAIQTIPNVLNKLRDINVGDSLAVSKRIDSAVSSPLLLTGIRELNNAWFYLPDEYLAFSDMAVAALLCELSLFGSCIVESEDIKAYIKAQFAPLLDKPNVNLDEVFAAISASGDGMGELTDAEMKTVDEVGAAGYKARSEMYRFMYRDFLNGDFSGKIR